MAVPTIETPTTHPRVKTMLLTRARAENSTTMIATIAIGLIATTTANGRTSLIALPISYLPYSPLVGGGGRNRTHRTGFARPTRFEDEGGHQTPFTSGAGLSASLPSEERPSTRRSAVKKLLVLLILVAIGIAVARKVREV